MRVGIVGAGITGLALHHALRERGVDAVVLEANDEPGGVIQSVERDGRVLDLGPQRTRLTPGVRELVDAAGLGEAVVEARDGPLYVYHDGDLGRVPLSVSAALRTDLLSLRGKLRAALEPLAGPPRPGETVEEYLERAFGREVATRVGGPLYAGLYASDPAEMPVEHSLARALEHLGVGHSVLLAALWSRLQGRTPPPAVSFDGGMGALPEHLYRRHRDRVRLNTPVETIRGARDGYELVVRSEVYDVDRVVLTVPAGAAASLLADVDPSSAAALDELSYNAMAVVHLVTDAPLEGAGHQVALDEGFVTRGVTWNDSLLDRDGVYTCYLGGAGRAGVLGWTDDRLAETAAAEFERATGYPANPLAVHRLTPGMPAYDCSWDALERVDTPPGVDLCASYESRAGVPGRVRRARRLADRIATEGAPAGRDWGSEEGAPAVFSPSAE